MKITVELPSKDIEEICKMTGIKKKGPAIRKVLADSLMMQKRREIAEKFMKGEYHAVVDGFEESREKARQEARDQAALWAQK